MAKTKTTRYDVAEHLRNPEEMAAYLEACLEEANGDATFIAKALGDIARAKGMSQVARDYWPAHNFNVPQALFLYVQQEIFSKEIGTEHLFCLPKA